jgi:hypothetical protein
LGVRDPGWHLLGIRCVRRGETSTVRPEALSRGTWLIGAVIRS